MSAFAFALLLLTATSSFGQVFRCTVNGQPVYQQAACAATASSGTEIKLNVAPAASPKATSLTPRPEPAPAVAVPAPAPAPPPPFPPQRSELEAFADTCLEWYRPLLRNPQGAYYRDAVHAQNVLSLAIYATNGFGGYVRRAAACEIKNGKLDAAWTRIHAQRAGWQP